MSSAYAVDHHDPPTLVIPTGQLSPQPSSSSYPPFRTCTYKRSPTCVDSQSSVVDAGMEEHSFPRQYTRISSTMQCSRRIYIGGHATGCPAGILITTTNIQELFYSSVKKAGPPKSRLDLSPRWSSPNLPMSSPLAPSLPCSRRTTTVPVSYSPPT